MIENNPRNRSRLTTDKNLYVVQVVQEVVESHELLKADSLAFFLIFIGLVGWSGKDYLCTISLIEITMRAVGIII